jgi:hypothetical protein
MADLIVRDHAAQAIEAYLCSQCDRNGNRECIACTYLDGDEILKSVPAVNRWIPCSERLPDRDTLAVFVSFEPWIYPDQPLAFYPHIGHRYGNQWQDSQTGAVFDDDDNKCKVTHWFPFPDVPSSGIPSVSPLDFLAAEWERKHPQQFQFQE